ncbi:unnamed protein product [Caenorhabditis nigoni]|uniref:Uncharacterized protein n=1 Tax=Caenorhabditis nigoni TaxID=1611254 RepID=A0A2G5SXP2_9PELO|nr:hypothetical protein B9Z55_025111 [Caenorhabditis nigoni]
MSSSNPPTTKVRLTVDDVKSYKSRLHQMKLKRMCANAMFILTNETIYRVTMETIDSTKKALKKVIRHGAGIFTTEKRTTKLLKAYAQHQKAYDSMMFKMEIAMMPSRALNVINTWLKDTLGEQEPAAEVSCENHLYHSRIVDCGMECPCMETSV